MSSALGLFVLAGLLVAGVSAAAICSGRRHTARLLAERLRSEQRLRDVVEAAGEYIWETNAEGRYTYVSDRARDILGRSPEQMIGCQPFDFLPESDRKAVSEKSEEIVAGRTSFRDFEHRFVRGDGTIIWISVNGLPSIDPNGNWIGYRGAGLDITERKEAQEALVREKEAAHAAVAAKGRFLAMMSHEIRTPLNSVLGFADLLAVTPLNDEQREKLNSIRKSGDALLALLNDILDFSRLEAEALPVHITTVSLSSLIGGVLEMQSPAVGDRPVELRGEISSLIPAFVRTDDSRVRQILLNLVGNAVKFTQVGSVTVKATWQPPGRVLFTITDTGIGIPSSARATIFQPFSQEDTSASRRHGGAGLGLAICRRLAELLGGSIRLVSSSSGGSVFEVDLPMEEASGPEGGSALVPEVEKRSSRTSSARVLVVEDNPVNRILTQRMLSTLGIDCETAESGEDGFDRHSASPFDVIFMDVQMPGMDGMKTTRHIRRWEAGRKPRPHVRIIALTADALSGDRERCIEAGMDDYMSKPIRRDVLAKKLVGFGIIVP